MRIAHLIDNLSVGGAQKLLVTFARELDYSEHQLTVVELRGDGHASMIRDIERTGAEIVSFPAAGLADVRRALALRRYCRDQQFDVIVTHLLHGNVLGGWLRAKIDTAVVGVLHNVAAPSGLLRRLLWRRALRKSDAIIACAHAVREAHAGWLGARPVTTLPNPVALPELLPAPVRAALRRDVMGDFEGALAISVGTVSPQKAFPDLIEAFARIEHAKHPVFLAIAGRGKPEAMAQVRDAIERHGIAERVALLGHRDDIESLLQAADLYVSSSRWEGLPISVLEAMAAGLPIVATEVGDNGRVVDADSGILVAPEQPARFADAVTRLLQDPAAARQRGHNARAAVAARHDPARWVADHLAVYASVAQDEHEAHASTARGAAQRREG